MNFSAFSQGCADCGAWGASHPPQYFQICKKVGQKAAFAGRELATVISVILLFFYILLGVSAHYCFLAHLQV